MVEPSEEPSFDDALRADRARLVGQIADLTDELESIVEASESSVPDDEHDAEGSTIGYERARMSALLEHARKRLAELDGAERLGRTVAGRSCQVCGRQIGTERIAAIPATQLCVACAGRS